MEEDGHCPKHRVLPPVEALLLPWWCPLELISIVNEGRSSLRNRTENGVSKRLGAPPRETPELKSTPLTTIKSNNKIDKRSRSQKVRSGVNNFAREICMVRISKGERFGHRAILARDN